MYRIEDKADFNVKRRELEKLLGHDYYPEFFRKMQDERHFP